MRISLPFLLLAGAAAAASHREAPFIARFPRVDGSDLYVFRSYETGREGFVTLLANYHPYQHLEMGPKLLDPGALYEVHLDNDGDCREDLTFQFRFRSSFKEAGIAVGGRTAPHPLAVSRRVTASDPGGQNVEETFTLTLVRGPRRSGLSQPVTHWSTGDPAFRKPVDYPGTRSLGTLEQYEDYARSFVHPIRVPGCASQGRVFVGQRDDRFNANIGKIFDSLDLDITAGPSGRSSLAIYSVTTLALELPIACVASSRPVVGAWTTASLRQARLLDPAPAAARPSVEGGAWTQVSRLGHPHVNGLFIGFPHKDAFNASRPAGDSAFLDYVTHPVLPAYIQARAGHQAPAPPRNDLVRTFLTGFPGFNETSGTCEMQRLNLLVPPTPAASQRSLGALGCFDPGPVYNPTRSACDPAGYPNGRRPGDDVTDILLRASMGALLPAAQAPAGTLPYTDQMVVSQAEFRPGFPYLPGPFKHPYPDERPADSNVN